jgi:putative hemolysin
VIYEMRMTLANLKGLVLSHSGVNPRQRAIAERLFDVRDRKLREVLLPRSQVVGLPGSLPVPEAMSRLVESGHSRAPVYGEEPDEVSGTIHLIDLIKAEGHGTVREHARTPVLLPESVSVLDALADLQQSRQTMALVIEEHGGFEGIVTVEDLVEELVGEVWDEFDLEPRSIYEEAPESFVVPGNMPVHRLAQYGVDLPQKPSWSTVAGYLLAKLQRIPSAGDTIESDGWRIEVMGMAGVRINEVRLTRCTKDEPKGGVTSGLGSERS